MDRGAWQTTVHGVAKSWTRLSDFHFTLMLIAALFTIAKTQKQPRCPPTDEWRRKLWYMHTMQQCSAIKRNAFESVQMRWMNLEPIMQSEVSQTDK